MSKVAALAVACALVLTFGPQLPADSATPRLTISPFEGGLLAKGKGFTRKARGVLVAGESPVARFRTSSRGTLKVAFPMSSLGAGSTKFTAKAGGKKATTTYTPPSTSPTPSPTPTPTPTPTVTPSPTPTPTPTSTGDAYTRRVRAELKVFTDWLQTNGVSGYMGEIGWPNNFPTDQAKYNALAELYMADMRAAGVKGAAWATGEWWGTSYALSPYVRSSGSSSLDATKPQAASLERFTDQVGIHVNGGEFGAAYGNTATHTFSNVNRGTYNTDWHYDNQGSFNYLASRGIREVVIPFRWERIQPTLSGPLDAAEVARLKDVIARAGNAGIKAVPMVANYAAYWLHDSATNKGVRRAIGSSAVPVAAFTDLWAKLSTELKNNANISAYGLMREPAGIAGATVRAQALVWEQASQAAVAAIRANGDSEHLLVPGYWFSNTHSWPNQHPSSWISDPLNNFSYEAHHYWASTYDAAYRSYADEVAYSQSRGY